MKIVLINATFLLLLTLGACNNSTDHKKVSSNRDSAAKDSAVHLISKKVNRINDSIKVNRSDSDKVRAKAINEAAIMRETRVDSLEKLIDKRYRPIYLEKLDIICPHCDGDLTEEFGILLKKLLFNKTTEFVDYLMNHPHSCLQTSLIESLGEDYSIYEAADRPKELIKDRDRLLSKAKKEGLSDQQIRFIKFIFSKVNPDILG